jgi:hypothetical protein
MPEEKGIGSKILGLFVESEGQESPTAPPNPPSGPGASKSAADEIAELARQAGTAPTAAGKPGAPPAAPAPAGPPLKLSPAAPAAAPGAALDFAAIFKDAGMDPAELDRVAKAEDLLQKLPASIGQAEKRTIVEASLKAFGFEIEKISAAAQNQKRALDAYVKVNETATAKAIADAEAQIKAFNEKIASLRAEIEKRTAQLSQIASQAQARKADVQKVVDFFQGPTPPPAG